MASTTHSSPNSVTKRQYLFASLIQTLSLDSISTAQNNATYSRPNPIRMLLIKAVLSSVFTRYSMLVVRRTRPCTQLFRMALLENLFRDRDSADGYCSR